jgi:hypothetical protein
MYSKLTRILALSLVLGAIVNPASALVVDGLQEWTQRTQIADLDGLEITSTGHARFTARVDHDATDVIIHPGGVLETLTDYKLPDGRPQPETSNMYVYGTWNAAEIQSFGVDRAAYIYIGAEGVINLERGYDDGTATYNALAWLDEAQLGGQSLLLAPELDPSVWSLVIEDMGDGAARISAMGPPPAGARMPNPEDGAIDVPRDVTLSWIPGIYAPATGAHTVFISESFTDVNDGLNGINQDPNSYNPGPLVLGQSYYWRVDEVNAAPDFTVHPGTVWTFTVEPVAYAVQSITATASGASNADTGPEKTIDGSGLDDMDQHSTLGSDMWMSAAGAGQWIQYEFAELLKLHEMWVWNSNQMIEPFVGLGAKDVIVETSVDGAAWTALAHATEFAQATGKSDYIANTVVDFGGVMAQFVRITINAGWGMLPQYGLSEVRFFSIPVQAREPQPADGAATNSANVVLQWRAGREAASHEVSLGTDSAALAVVGTSAEASFDPGPLDYSTTYFWRVDEVNLAETPAPHTGNLWSFTTPPYAVVDNFDQYDDDCQRIFFAWADGLGHNGGEEIAGCDVPASNGNGGGSIVGNDQAPFAEQTIVTTGSRQSLPFNYDNSFGASEASLSIPTQDWTASGVQTLSLAFYGTEGNTGTLYVKINNSKLSYDLDPTDIARASWQTWNIDLTALSGLQNVTQLTIGVDGANAAGMLYIDDIRLHPQASELITPVQPDDTGLLSYLAFDEGAGSVARDSSGNGHDASLEGPPQWSTGEVGGALQFGSGSYVLDEDAEDYLNGLEALSISLWIKSGVIDTDTGFLIAKDPTDQDNSISMRYDAAGVLSGGNNVLKVAVTTDSGEQQLESSSSRQSTEWQHLCMTWTSGGLLRLYIDGMEDMPTGRNNANNTGPVSTCEKLIIGKGGKDIVNSAGWDGLIDEVRIYGRALAAEEAMWLAGRTQPVYKPL